MDKLEENSILFYKLPNVFYNKDNAQDRLFSSELIKSFKANTYLDAMAGCGIRGLYLKDTLKVYVNDVSKVAYENLKLNYEENNCFNLPFIKINIQTDIIELDPFGSCRPYLSHLTDLDNTVVVLTYTDIINLCKQKNSYNERIYGIDHPYVHCYNEYALRLILYDIAKQYNLKNKKISVVTCYPYKHLLRIYLKISKGKNKIKTVYYCTICRLLLFDTICFSCSHCTKKLNNLWGNKLHTLKKKLQTHKFLNLYRNMAIIDMHEWYRKYKISCFKDSFLASIGIYKAYSDKFFYYCNKQSILKLKKKTAQYTS